VLSEFDVVLTNPPFGEGRALRLDDPHEGAANRIIALRFHFAAVY
jgi:16S rRNA G1207 methylase RsmC